MRRLKDDLNGSMFFTGKIPFTPGIGLKPSTIEKTFDFAYDMTFNKQGEHRNHRSGGTHVRRQGEIFADTFQGKLAEFAIYNHLYKDFDVNVPDLDVWSLGKWDSCDLVVNGAKIAIKSTKAFGQLLLLETKDWDNNGCYIPNKDVGESEYDFFFLVRMRPFAADLLKDLKLYYSDTADYNLLKSAILAEKWEYDIPGFITREDLIYIIRNGFIIPQGAMLNGRMRMDAENYYCQAIDMKPISELKNFII